MIGLLKKINSSVGREEAVAKELSRLRSLPRYSSGQSNVFGFPMQFSDACTFVVGGREIFQREVYRFEAKRSDLRILDCGANIGMASVYFKRAFPGARVTCFEPDPTLAEIATKNLRANGFTDIDVHAKAVWTADGEVFFEPEGGFSGRIIEDGERRDSEVARIPCVRLRDLLGEPIDFLKLDVEGAEVSILRDCRGYFKNVSRLFVEYHSRVDRPQELGEVLEILKDAGFRYHLKGDFVRRQPFVDRDLMLDWDMTVNIFGEKEEGN